MRLNRSCPPSRVVPVLSYPDVRAAVGFLTDAFGLHERVRIGEDHRSQMGFDADGSLIVADVRGERTAPRPGEETHRVMVRVADVDAHHEHARAHGARILRPPTTHPFGERQYEAEDLAGHRWTFSQTVADTAPEEWGGTMGAPPARRSALLDRLNVLVGEWTAEAISDGQVLARERVTFDWVEGGAFVAFRSVNTVMPDAPPVWHENAPASTTGIIAADDGSGTFTYSYADSRGVSRVYAMTLDADGTWTQSGRPGETFHQRWYATVGPETIKGRYEQSADGRAWELDFEMRYRRVA